MNLWDQLRQSDAEVKARLNQMEVGFAQRDADDERRSKNNMQRRYEDYLSDVQRERDEALNELAQARRIIQTLEMESTMMTVMAVSIASGLERATLDVAQLTAVPPDVAEARYTLAVIDSMRFNMDSEVLPVNEKSTWGSKNISDRYAKYLANSMQVNQLVSQGVSYSDATKTVAEKSPAGMTVLTFEKALKWLGNDASLMSSPTQEVISKFKPIDDAMIVAINLNSKMNKPGCALHPVLGEGTQSASRFYDGVEAGRPIPYYSIQSESPMADKWRMDLNRMKPFSTTESQAHATGILKYLSKMSNFDVSDPNAVMPRISFTSVVSNPSKNLNASK